MSQVQVLLNVVVGVVLPMLVAVIAHQMAPSRLKAALLVVLAAGGSALTTALSAVTFSWTHVEIAFVTQLSAAITAHMGLLQPLGITGASGTIATRLRAGMGAPASPGAEGDAAP